MDRREICVGGKPARRFSFSWADEVEREEAAQQQQHEEEKDENQPPPPRRGGETEEQTTKLNPFGAARPREVVLAEKGVDWRARDLELDGTSRRASAARSRTRAARRHEDSTPATSTSTRRKSTAPPVSYGSAWGGKRKCSGQDEPLSRHVRPVADHGRRVFGQLNIGEEGEFCRWGCSASRGAVCTDGIGAGKAAIVGDEIADRCTVPIPAGTETGGCGAGRRRGKRGGRRLGSNKAKKQQALLL
uniref:Uncharacterized protein n=1 Tax=Leersia perrieri TaxID=77586 RepID=A0A0D9V052_9ORYZ